MSNCHHLSSILDLSYTWCSTSSFKCSRHMQWRHTGDTGDRYHRGDGSSVGYHGGGPCRTPFVCSTHTLATLHLTSAPMSLPSCRRCRRRHRSV